jgi:hypothetical protein
MQGAREWSVLLAKSCALAVLVLTSQPVRLLHHTAVIAITTRKSKM